MHAATRATSLIVLTFTMIAVTDLGCGGGGGGGGGNGINQSACLAFEPGASPGSGRVTLRTVSGSTCDLQRLEVVASDVADLFAVSFTVVYDRGVVAYGGYSLDGSVLSSGGAAVEAIVTDVPGRITLGLSRVAPAVGADVTAARPVVHLVFSRIASSASSCPVYFEDAAVLGDETPPAAKAGIEWFGGVLRVQ